MVSLYQDPEGLTVFRGETTAVASAAKASSDQTIETLRRRIRELETIISQNGQNVRVFAVTVGYGIFHEGVAVYTH